MESSNPFQKFFKKILTGNTGPNTNPETIRELHVPESEEGSVNTLWRSYSQDYLFVLIGLSEDTAQNITEDNSSSRRIQKMDSLEKEMLREMVPANMAQLDQLEKKLLHVPKALLQGVLNRTKYKTRKEVEEIIANVLARRLKLSRNQEVDTVDPTLVKRAATAEQEAVAFKSVLEKRAATRKELDICDSILFKLIAARILFLKEEHPEAESMDVLLDTGSTPSTEPILTETERVVNEILIGSNISKQDIERIQIMRDYGKMILELKTINSERAGKEDAEINKLFIELIKQKSDSDLQRIDSALNTIQAQLPKKSKFSEETVDFKAVSAIRKRIHEVRLTHKKQEVIKTYPKNIAPQTGHRKPGVLSEDEWADSDPRIHRRGNR